MPLTVDPKLTSNRAPTAFERYMTRTSGGNASGLSKIQSTVAKQQASKLTGPAPGATPPALRQAVTQGPPTAIQSDYDYVNSQFGQWYDKARASGMSDAQIAASPTFKQFQDKIVGLAGQTTDPNLISSNVSAQDARVNDPVWGTSAKAIQGAFQTKKTAIENPPLNVSDATQIDPSKLTPTQLATVNQYMTKYLRDTFTKKYGGDNVEVPPESPGALPDDPNNRNGTWHYKSDQVGIDLSDPNGWNIATATQYAPGFEKGLVDIANGKAPPAAAPAKVPQKDTAQGAPANPNSTADLARPLQPTPLQQPPAGANAAPAPPSGQSPWGAKIQELLDRAPTGPLPSTGAALQPGSATDMAGMTASAKPIGMTVAPDDQRYKTDDRAGGAPSGQGVAAAQSASNAALSGYTGQPGPTGDLMKTQGAAPSPTPQAPPQPGQMYASGADWLKANNLDQNGMPISAQSTPDISGGLPKGQGISSSIGRVSSSNPSPERKPAKDAESY